MQLQYQHTADLHQVQAITGLPAAPQDHPDTTEAQPARQAEVPTTAAAAAPTTGLRPTTVAEAVLSAEVLLHRATTGLHLASPEVHAAAAQYRAAENKAREADDMMDSGRV